jgi:hypothetical protein
MLTLRVFSIIFPVFAVALAGYAYARLKQPDMTFANQLNMDVFVPALIFSVLANKSFQLGEYGALALGGVAVVLLPGPLVLPFVKLLKVDYRTFVPPMMFNNSGNMGIPLLVLAFGEQALAAAVVLFLVEMVLHFTVGMYILDHQTRFLRLLSMPMIAAMIAGLAVSFSGLALPDWLLLPIKMLGDICIPLMLFALGVRLAQGELKDLRMGLWGAILCPLSGVVVALAVMPFLDISPAQQGMLLVFAALPPAVLNYIVSEQYRQEPDKVASIVMVGNLGSIIVMPIVLAFALK